MKKIFFAAFAALAMVACSDNDNKGDKLVVNTDDQTVYADEIETLQTINFTAPEPWTASVSAETRASNVDWLRLMIDGEETYSGAAGTFSLVVEIDPNTTGQRRSATVTIESGGQTMSLTVTQEGETIAEAATEGGSDDMTGVPVTGMRLVKSITVNQGYGDYVTAFHYDSKNRVDTIYIEEYLKIAVNYFRGRVIFTSREVDYDGYGINVVQLDNNGWAKSTSYTYTGEDGYTGSPETGTMTVDSNGYLSHTYPHVYVEGDATSSRYLWSNGNMMKYVRYMSTSGGDTQTQELNFQYGSVENKALCSVDLNSFFMHGYFDYNDLMSMHLLGKPSAKMISQYTQTQSYNGDYDDYEEVYTFDYDVDNRGYVTSASLYNERLGMTEFTVEYAN